MSETQQHAQAKEDDATHPCGHTGGRLNPKCGMASAARRQRTHDVRDDERSVSLLVRLVRC